MTLEPGATASTQCYCKEGYQRKQEGEKCSECMPDAICQGGLNEALILAKPG